MPSAELGLRHDTGDAQTGTGIELGLGLRYAWGRLSIDTRDRTLLAHEDYEEWGLSGGLTVNPNASGRGLTLSIAPERGRMGSATERLWGAPDACELDGGTTFEPEAGFVAEAGYGIAVPCGADNVTPYTGLSWAREGVRTQPG